MRTHEGASGRSVIINPAFLGDSVFDGVLARAIKVRNPGAYVGLVVRHPYEAIARYMPHVDAIHVFDKRGRDVGWRGLSRVATELRDARYDRAYVVHPSVRSALLAYRSGIGERRGFSQGWMARRSLTHPTQRQPEDTFTQDRLRLLDANKMWPASLTSLRGVLRVQEASLVRMGGVRLGLAVGSEVATKQWPIEHAAELVARNQHPEVTWVLLGSPAERSLCQALLSRLRGTERVEDRVGEDLSTLVPCVAGLDLLVAGDTGPLFVARALGVPTIGLFGPTPEFRHQAGPHDYVLTVPLPCRPCSPHGPRRCPERHHRCLRDVTVEEVSEATYALLAGGHRRGTGGAKSG